MQRRGGSFRSPFFAVFLPGTPPPSGTQWHPMRHHCLCTHVHRLVLWVPRPFPPTKYKKRGKWVKCVEVDIPRGPHAVRPSERLGLNTMALTT